MTVCSRGTVVGCSSPWTTSKAQTRWHITPGDGWKLAGKTRWLEECQPSCRSPQSKFWYIRDCLWMIQVHLDTVSYLYLSEKVVVWHFIPPCKLELCSESGNFLQVFQQMMWLFIIITWTLSFPEETCHPFSATQGVGSGVLSCFIVIGNAGLDSVAQVFNLQRAKSWYTFLHREDIATLFSMSQGAGSAALSGSIVGREVGATSSLRRVPSMRRTFTTATKRNSVCLNVKLQVVSMAKDVVF